MSEKRTLVALVFEETSQAGVLGGGSQSVSGGAIVDAQPHNAEATLQEIVKVAKDEEVELKDAVIAFRTGDGRVKIRQTKDLTAGKGAGRGTLMGFLVGLIFGGPLLGALGGLAIGAIIGKRTDRGLDDEFVKEVSKSLKPGSSAVLLLIDRRPGERGMAYLESFNAQLFVTDMSSDAEEAARQASEDEEVIKAVQAELDTE